ncbi:MAG: AAA family ATPase [Saprospiraceae bacterium]
MEEIILGAYQFFMSCIGICHSIWFQTDSAKYSEAFAGSGEMAVVRLVQEILKADDYSLILLDEPEVSLHPGAQSRLKTFLLDQIKRKKHQIILSSHSPILVKDLPKEAVKVFYQNIRTNRFSVKEGLTPDEAFYHIGYEVEKNKIIVEDSLAKEILLAVFEDIGLEAKNLFQIDFHPGGQSVIKKEFIPVFCRNGNPHEYVVFDGDQKPTSGHLDWRTLPVLDSTKENIQQLLNSQTSEIIKFSIDGGDGGSRIDQELDLLKKYADFYLNNVFYLPNRIPEDIIWDQSFARNHLDANISGDELEQFMLELQNESSTKKKFAKFAEVIFGSSDGIMIEATHKMFINNFKKEKKNEFQEIKNMIGKIISKLNSPLL